MAYIIDDKVQFDIIVNDKYLFTRLVRVGINFFLNILILNLILFYGTKNLMLAYQLFQKKRRTC